ncbi:MAG: hypothetical protein QW625_00045 [Candidatus Nanoarchaeia archaeon]
MARWLLPVLFLIIASAPVAAATVDFKVIPIKDQIDWNATAQYKVVMYNNGQGDTFFIRPANLNWGYVTVKPAIIAVAGNGFSETDISVSPPADVRIGSYALEILAISESDKLVKGSTLLKMEITSESPKVEAEWGIPAKLLPGEQTDVNLILKNTGKAEVTNVKAVLSSPLLPENISFNVDSLKSGQAALFWNYKLTIPTNTEAKNYDFELKFYDKNNNLISKQSYTVSVVKKPIVNVKVEKNPRFLGTGYFVVIENIGNTEAIDFYKIQLPSWQKVFLQSKLKPVIKKAENFVEVAWMYNIPKGESKVIAYQISYIPLLALLISLFFVGYASSLYFRRDLIITKDVVRSEKALKVLVKAKNVSNKPIRNLIIADFVPTPLKLVKQPCNTKIKKEAGTAKLLAKYDVLWPGEEKVTEYEIKSTLNIIGSIILPPAKGKYKDKDKTKLFSSNSVLIRGRPSVVEITEEE